MVRVGGDTYEWLDWSWIVGPFRIIASSATREFGMDFSWQRVSNEPLKAVFI